MKISTRLALTGAISVAVIGSIGAVVVSTDRTVRQELVRNATAGEILNGVFSVRYLLQEYVLHHEERARAQLSAREVSLSKLFTDPKNSADLQGEILGRLRQTGATVQSLFSQIVKNYETMDIDDRKSTLFQELEERLTGQIMIRIEAMISDAAALSEHSRQGVLMAQNRESAAVAAFGGFILLIFTATMFVAVTSVFRPLARLRTGVALVGAGDFNLGLNDFGNDEISDLARAFNDMTDKLRSREAKIRRLVESNIIGIVISDTDGTVLEANDAFLKLIGYDRRDLEFGRLHGEEITPADARLADICALQELSETGTYVPFEKEYLHKDGRRIPVMIGGALIEGRPASIVSFVLDLTERKLAQEALARTQADLTHMARVSSLGAMTASIAHEVSQPLLGIITNASTCLRMLAADPPNVDGARETAKRRIRDGSRASDVITRLRALFAKKEAATEPVDLSEATREVIALLRSEFRKGRLILHMELAEDLPYVIGDRVQLQQVILNLLANAADAMTNVDDRPRRLVIKTARDEEDGVRLTVQDTGVGIAAPDPERIFEAFYTTKSEGMGVGLFVSRSIIESHRGRIWAASNDGPGAAFSFFIPLHFERSMGAQSPGTRRVPIAPDGRQEARNL